MNAYVETIREPARDVPIVHQCDVCVIGASCTGVFAAVTAAKLGASVALIEGNAFFGGVATAGLVNIWHSLHDTVGELPIIGGLTADVVNRLMARDAAVLHTHNASKHATLNTAELTIELDALVTEQRAIRPFLHTHFAAPVGEAGEMTAAIIEDKTGRRAIRAKTFIDATGDGDLISRLGLPTHTPEDLQPPTVCAAIRGLNHVEAKTPGFNLSSVVHDPAYPNALKRGLLWASQVVGTSDCRMVAGTRVHNADCSDADQLTMAEMEARRQVRAIRDIVHDNFEGGDQVSLVTLSSYIGIRETRHASCQYQLTEHDVLEGIRFDDAVANGSYRVDVHHSEKAGLTFRYLDGRETYHEPGEPTVEGRWRDERDTDPTFYQVPFRCLQPKGARNVLVAGRLMDADRGAYGAVRVMVNCNQTGEAAGAACALACRNKCGTDKVDPEEIRATLSALGSIII